MTTGYPRRIDSPYPSRERRAAPLLLLVAAVALAACSDTEPAPPSDTTAPTVAITDDVSDSTATGPVTFTFTFSEDVGTSFTVSDVTVTGGTADAFARSSATVYTLVVNLPPASLGTVAVAIPIGAFSDLAANASTAIAVATQGFSTVLSPMSLPVTFDSSHVAYGLVGFGGADDSSIAADPAGGANQVAKVVRSATAESWAGTTVTTADGAGFEVPVPFDASNTRMTVRVYAPDTGIQVRIKAEDHADATVTVETEATTTVANAWETLTFDFAEEVAGTAALDPSKRYDKVSIFFDFGVAGAVAGEQTYYFDDLVFVGGGGLGGGGETAPSAAPERPTRAAADVISLLGDAYTNVAVDTWRTSWSSAVLEDVVVGADHVKKYTSLDFVGVETTGANLVDASGMDFLHVDVWTPNATTFRIKLVDFGADAGYGGGDDTEHELAFNAASTPALTTGSWVSLDLPLSSFANLTTRGHLAQYIFSALPTGTATVYVANVYFYKAPVTPPAAPTAAPARPTQAAGTVVSLLSDAYTDVVVDTWRTSWSSATLEDVVIGADHVKKYSALDFVGIETTGGNLVDATATSFLHVDVWTPDATTFRIKLVDFGADAGYGGGDDSEHELVFNASSAPALVTGSWVALDIPLASFTNLTSRAHLAQYIFAAQPTSAATVYVANVYFHQ
jgi:hypothetical protein